MAIDNAEPEWQHHVATIQAGTDSAAVDAAIGALKLLIENTAERVCRRLVVANQIRVDFVGDAVAFVLVVPRRSREDGSLRPPIMKYDSASGKFPAWLRRVLENRLKDVCEAANRLAAHEQSMVADKEQLSFADRIAAPRLQSVDDDLDRTTPFSVHDFNHIAAWNVRDRILVLVVLDLWRKIPPAIWTEWCSEAELPIPFPPEPERQRERSEWISLIAEIRSESPSALNVRLGRRCLGSA